MDWMIAHEAAKNGETNGRFILRVAGLDFLLNFAVFMTLKFIGTWGEIFELCWGPDSRASDHVFILMHKNWASTNKIHWKINHKCLKSGQKATRPAFMMFFSSRRHTWIKALRLNDCQRMCQGEKCSSSALAYRPDHMSQSVFLPQLFHQAMQILWIKQMHELNSRIQIFSCLLKAYFILHLLQSEAFGQVFSKMVKISKNNWARGIQKFKFIASFKVYRNV